MIFLIVPLNSLPKPNQWFSTWYTIKIEEEERRLEAAIEETERQNAEVNAELKELELKSSRFKELEERFIFLCSFTTWYVLIKSTIIPNKISENVDKFWFFLFGVCGCLWCL